MRSGPQGNVIIYTIPCCVCISAASPDVNVEEFSQAFLADSILRLKSADGEVGAKCITSDELWPFKSLDGTFCPCIPNLFNPWPLKLISAVFWLLDISLFELWTRTPSSDEGWTRGKTSAESLAPTCWAFTLSGLGLSFISCGLEL